MLDSDMIWDVILLRGNYRELEVMRAPEWHMISKYNMRYWQKRSVISAEQE